MSKLQERINKLEELEEKLRFGDNEAVTLKSFQSLLYHHLKLLKEVDSLVDAFDNGDTEFVEKWYNRRK